MRILMLHNYYQQRGGEDAVFEAESALLTSQGHDVSCWTVHNDVIQSKSQQLKTAWQTIYNAPLARQLKQHISHFKPDVMHVHNFFPQLSPAIFKVATQQCVPVVMTLHNYRLICSGALLMRGGQACFDCTQQMFPYAGIRHKCYRQSTLATAVVTGMTGWHKLRGTWRHDIQQYIALSEFSKRQFLQSGLGLSTDKIKVLPNFTADVSVVDKPSQDYFIYIGRLSPEKGVDILLELAKNSVFPIHIVGSGPLEEQVRAMSQHYSHIQYHGFLSQAEILPLLQHAKALLFPSVCFENCPLTLIEALACGTPVIAHALGGPAEMITHGQTGFLMQETQTSAWLQQLNLLYQEEPDWAALRYNARQTYEARYHPNAHAAQLIQYYQNATVSYAH